MEKSVKSTEKLNFLKKFLPGFSIFFFLFYQYSTGWAQNPIEKVVLSSYVEQLSYSQLTRKISKTPKLFYQATLMKMKKSIPPQFITLVLPHRSGKTKSLLQKGVLITYHSFQAKKVEVGGSFNNWQRIPLKQNLHGVWFAILEVKPGQNLIYYKLSIDDSWVPNPLGQTRFLIGSGGKVSVFNYNYIIFDKQAHASVGRDGRVLFQIYSPDAHRVSVAGNFNQWNVWHDFLKKGKDGIWRIKLFLKSGKFIYRYYVDDKWQLDLYNPKTRLDKTGILSSMIVVP